MLESQRKHNIGTSLYSSYYVINKCCNLKKIINTSIGVRMSVHYLIVKRNIQIYYKTWLTVWLVITV